MFDLRRFIRRLMSMCVRRAGLDAYGANPIGRMPEAGSFATARLIPSLPATPAGDWCGADSKQQLAATRDEHADAADRFARALDIDDSDLNALIGLGSIDRARGDAAGAVSHWSRALALAPATSGLHYNLACAYAEAGDLTSAVSKARAARAADADPLPAALLLGQLFELGGDTALAANAYTDAISLDPLDKVAWAGLGRARRDRAEFGLAEAAFIRAGPGFEIDVALACYNQNRHLDAIDTCTRLLVQEPQRADARMVLANARLATGDIAAGWLDYEARLQVSGVAWPKVSLPVWNGELLNGTLLVDCEQGFGDCLYAVRFLASARTRVRRLVLRCPLALHGLFEASAVADEIVAADALVTAADAHAWLLSLPGLLGIDSARAIAGYLRIGSEPLARWRRRLAGPGSAIGLVWSGLATAPQNRYRRFDPAPLVTRLAGLGRLYSLQLPAAGVEPCPPAVIDLAPELSDFGETAAAVCCLDLVISAETAVAHLAGALGVRAWIPLPLTADWRWEIAGRQSPWYSSVRVFRQSRPMYWDDIFDAIKNDIRNLDVASGARSLSPVSSSGDE